jgi:hypothetical protein
LLIRAGEKGERTDLRFHIINGVGGLDLKGDGLARQGLDEAVAVVIASVSCSSSSVAAHCGATKPWGLWKGNELTSALHAENNVSDRFSLLPPTIQQRCGGFALYVLFTACRYSLVSGWSRGSVLNLCSLCRWYLLGCAGKGFGRRTHNVTAREITT